jgi:hypothetical protein
MKTKGLTSGEIRHISARAHGCEAQITDGDGGAYGVDIATEHAIKILKQL